MFAFVRWLPAGDRRPRRGRRDVDRALVASDGRGQRACAADDVGNPA